MSTTERLPSPKAILFDWDNTLVDTWPIIHQALHDTMHAYGLTPWTIEEVKNRVARSMRDAFPELFGEVWQEAGELYMTNYRKYNIAQLTPLPGALAVLEAIHGTPVFRGVVSNKRSDNLRAEVAHLGWGKYFHALVGSGDVPRDKPHGDPVLKVLEGSGIEPGAHVWLVGDSHVDLECAQNLGLTPVFYLDEIQTEPHYKGFPYHRHVRNHVALRQLLMEHR